MWQRFVEELREYAFISSYLWVCFTTLALYKTAVLRAEDVQFMPLGTAVIKALVIGKFILVGKAVKVGSRATQAVLIHRILWKSLAFLLLLMALTTLEEVIVGVVHGKSMAQSLSEFAGRPLIEIIAPSVVMLMVLIPLITFEEVDRAVGHGKLRQVLFGKVSEEQGSRQDP